jgi:hypothetical protein
LNCAANLIAYILLKLYYSICAKKSIPVSGVHVLRSSGDKIMLNLRREATPVLKYADFATFSGLEMGGIITALSSLHSIISILDANHFGQRGNQV